MTTSTVTPEIATFAQGVRTALADLPGDEVDDLTDGLEADLAEAYAEDLQRELPDPTEYAAELRLAAGLPVRAKVKGGTFAAVADSLRDSRRDMGAAIRRNPALSGLADFLITLRPVWWVLRAWLATWLVASVFGGQQGYWFSGTGWFFVLAAFATISVQWGRGLWRGKGAGPLLVLGNVFAAIVLLPVVAAADDWSSSDYYTDAYAGGQPEQSTGMTLDGQSVTNIFAYGADGKPLTGVQLFDQDGRPLETHLDPFRDECGDGECAFSADGLTAAPVQLETGVTARNVFPLAFLTGLMDEVTNEVSPDPKAVPQPAKAPFVKVPAVMPAPKVADGNR